MTAKEVRNFFVFGLIFLAAAALPLTGEGYWMSVAIPIAMYTVLATSWTLFSGPTHYISLATTAFFGVGMYVVGAGVNVLPFPVLILIAGLVGAVLAAVVGLSTIRISGVYFVIFTLGLSELIRQVMTWAQTTMGTSSGLYVLTDVTENQIYWILLALAAITFIIGWWVERSRLGFALRIIGNDETVARHCGIDTTNAKLALFIISGVIATIVGAVLAPRWAYVEPTIAFNPLVSFQVAIMALLGGTHRLWGPMIGVIPFTLFWELITKSFPNQTTLLLGVSFLLIVYLIPNGFVGLAENLLWDTDRRQWKWPWQEKRRSASKA